MYWTYCVRNMITNHCLPVRSGIDRDYKDTAILKGLNFKRVQCRYERSIMFIVVTKQDSTSKCVRWLLFAKIAVLVGVGSEFVAEYFGFPRLFYKTTTLNLLKYIELIVQKLL